MYQQQPEPSTAELRRNAIAALLVLAVVMMASFVITSVWTPS
jgi:hypothetical protein